MREVRFHAARSVVAAVVMGAGALCFGLAPRVLAQTAGAAGDFNWQALGERTYDTNCSGCHQRSGRGIPGGFPPLAGHAPQLLARPGGHPYLIRLVLFGLAGAIEVEGASYNGSMPSWSSLKDDQIAAVINHVLTGWGNDVQLPKDFKPIIPSEVAAARADNLTPEQVYALREQSAPGESRAPRAAQMRPSFTREQAERGQAAYGHSCLDCHGSNLDNGEFGGPPLKGASFARHWDGGSVAGLFGFMRAKMPPDRPGQLAEETYADLTAYILGENGYQPGDKELSADVNAQQAMSLKR